MLIKIGNKEYNDSEIEVLAKAGVLSIGQKHDPASTTLDAPALHGPLQGNANQFGIFSIPGVRPDRFTTLQRPRSFLRSLPPPRRSEYTQEKLDILTGQTASSGTNPSSFCGNPLTVGQLKTCVQYVNWGRYYVKTNLEAIPEIGQLRDRADIPANILNAGPADNPYIPDIMYRLMPTRSHLNHELFRIGVDLERTLELTAIRGSYTGALQSNYVGWFNEFEGLDTWIRTGYTDEAISGGPLCPSVDSSIISFNAAVTGTMGDGRNIVQACHDLFFGLRDIADSVGMNDVVWVIVMRKEMFRAVVDQWVCNYATYRCADGAAGSPLNRDVVGQNEDRLKMMTGQYLLHDGIALPVVFSEGINNPAIANQTYEADMYYVPMSWQGMPLTYLEYFPIDNPYAQEFANFTGQDKQVINNGMFLVAKRTTGMCDEYHFASKMRMIMETPFLAGRVDNVNYTYRAPTREAIPGTSLYVDGGVTYRS